MAIRLAVLGSGSAGNATCIEGGGARILLDAGFSARETARRLRGVGVEPHRIDAIVLTHEHGDHVRGASLFSRTFQVPVYCTAGTFRAARLDVDGVHAWHGLEAGACLTIGAMRVRPFPVPHDAVETVGYLLECGGARLGYATDLGHPSAAVRACLRGCDLLMLEANHDVEMLKHGPYPEAVKDRVLGRHGHLDNETAADLASDVACERTEHLILAHVSRTNNLPHLAVRAARAGFARAGRRTPQVHAAEQGAPSAWFEV